MKTLYIGLQVVNVLVILFTLFTVIRRCRQVQRQGERLQATILTLMGTQQEIRDYLVNKAPVIAFLSIVGIAALQ
jgi:hypothetical protein